jgi:hypothetical protein
MTVAFPKSCGRGNPLAPDVGLGMPLIFSARVGRKGSGWLLRHRQR